MSRRDRDSITFLALLRSNPNYRRVWIGEAASWLGDWFAAIAMYTLVRDLTGSPFALGLVFITKILPFAVASPLAGLLVDRFNRRRLMIASDLTRAVLVLGLLLVDRAEELILLYGLVTLQVFLTAVFIPARSASIPNITSPRELLTANALSAATWSTILAIGAALGGLVTEWLGTSAVFLIDSATYVVSAWFLFRTIIPQRTERGEGRGFRAAIVDTVAGWRHVRVHPAIGRMVSAKAVWSLGGGGLVYMLALIGENLAGFSPAVGIGILYGARGLGTGIGPMLMRHYLPTESRWPLMLGLGIAATGITYVAIGSLPWTLGIAALVAIAHAPSGANWVASTVLLQKRTVDEYRGRVFSTEWLLITLSDSASILAASLLLEAGVLTLETGLFAFGALQIVCGLVWVLRVVPAERAAAQAA